jgi:hypothetical protein
MPSQGPQTSLELSQEHFANPESYGHFTFTPDDRILLDCIEPRNPADIAHGSYYVTVQGPGGGAGEGLVGGVARTALSGEFVSTEAALTDDEKLRANNILAAHIACTFIDKMEPITAEMADPSDRTLANYERWAVSLGHQELATSSLRRVRDASARQHEDVQDREHMLHLVEHIDALHPEHENITGVEGEGGAGVYVVNLHPNIGQDRNRQPVGPSGEQIVRAYHDSLAASLVELHKATELTDEERGLRIPARILVAAATFTVIQGANPDITMFEVMRSSKHPSGRQITEIQS